MADNDTGRANIAGDYLLIEYDADTHGTVWFDYHHTLDFHGRYERAYSIARNGSFLPVVYTREKIAVHVCDLHFTDQLTVTTSPLSLPEGGADIRGSAATTTLTSLTSSLDALQNGTATGVAVSQSGVGYSPTTALSLAAVAGVTPGNLTTSSGTVSYTVGSVTVSGKQLAQMMYALRANAADLVNSVATTRGYAAPSLPGSIPGIEAEIQRVQTKIAGEVAPLKKYMDAGIPISSKDQAALDAAANYAGFDEDLTQVQSLSAELTALSSSLSSQGFGARAVTLQNNYATLAGVLDFIRQGYEQRDCQVYVAPDKPAAAGAKVWTMSASQIAQIKPSEFAKIPVAELKLLNDKQIAAITGEQMAELSAAKLDALLRAKGAPTDPGKDQQPCSAFEKEKFKEFLFAYRGELARLNGAADPNYFNAKQFELETDGLVKQAFEQLNSLKTVELADIDDKIGTIFEEMNGWYNMSSVEQTDVLTPASNNTLMRISIVVQRGYVPFTLTNIPAGSLPNAPAPAAAASPSASTSTPAHSVKTVLAEVHRLANFNLAGGVMIIHVPTATYSVVAGTTTAVAAPTSSNPLAYTGYCNGVPVTLTASATNTVPVSGTPGVTYTTPTYSCITQTQQTNWQVAGMAGVVWFPSGHDYFPRSKGYSNYGRNYIPALMVATSVTSFGSAFGGGDFEPFGGIDFFAGIASANRNVLPQGLAPNNAVASGYVLPNVTQLHVGFAAGVAFDLSVFTQLFAKTSGLPSGGLP